MLLPAINFNVVQKFTTGLIHEESIKNISEAQHLEKLPSEICRQWRKNAHIWPSWNLQKKIIQSLQHVYFTRAQISLWETYLIICLRHGNRRRCNKRPRSRTVCVFENQSRSRLSLLLSCDFYVTSLHDCLLLLSRLRQLVCCHWRECYCTILHRSTRECDTVVIHCHDRRGLCVVVCRIH